MLFFGSNEVSVLLSVAELEEVKNILSRGVKDMDAVRVLGETTARSSEEIIGFAKAREHAEWIVAAINSGGKIHIDFARGAGVDELGQRRRALEAAKYFFEMAKKPFDKHRLKFV